MLTINPVSGANGLRNGHLVNRKYQIMLCHEKCCMGKFFFRVQKSSPWSLQFHKVGKKKFLSGYDDFNKLNTKKLKWIINNRIIIMLLERSVGIWKLTKIRTRENTQQKQQYIHKNQKPKTKKKKTHTCIYTQKRESWWLTS